MPEHSDDIQQEQGASHPLPPFFAPRARARRVTPPGVGLAGKGRLAPLFTPPAARRLGAAGDEARAEIVPSSSGLVVGEEMLPPAPEGWASGEGPGTDGRTGEVAPELHGEYEAQLAPQGLASGEGVLSIADVEELEDATLELPEAEPTERFVEYESAEWPAELDTGDPEAAASTVYNTGDQDDGSRYAEPLELEREEWVPEATHSATIGVESFWAAEPFVPSTSSPELVESAADLAHAPDSEMERAGFAEFDSSPHVELGPPGDDPVAVDEQAVQEWTPEVMSTGDELSAALAWPSEAVNEHDEPLDDGPPPIAEQALVDATPELRQSAAPWADASDDGTDDLVSAPESYAAALEPVGGELLSSARETEPAWPGALAASTLSVPDATAEETVEPSAEVWVGDASGDTSSDASSDTPPDDSVAAALDRIARRIRDGELVLPGDAGAATDEGALAQVLAALLRGGARG